MYRLNRCGYMRDKLDSCALQRIMTQSTLRRENGCGCDNKNESEINEIKRTGCGNQEPRESSENESCGCGCKNSESYNAEFNYSLAMVYSPYQQWQNLYCEDEGLLAGTIFKELDKPFYGSRCDGGKCNE